MPTVRKNDDFRFWNQTLELISVLSWKQAIRVAPEHDGRHVDKMQPFVQMRVVIPWLPGQERCHHAVFKHNVFRARFEGSRKCLIGQRLIAIEAADPFLVRGKISVDLLDAADMKAG